MIVHLALYVDVGSEGLSAIEPFCLRQVADCSTTLLISTDSDLSQIRYFRPHLLDAYTLREVDPCQSLDNHQRFQLRLHILFAIVT